MANAIVVRLPPTPPNSPNGAKRATSSQHAMVARMSTPQTPTRTTEHSVSDAPATPSDKGGPDTPQSRKSSTPTRVEAVRSSPRLSPYRPRLEDFELIRVVGKGCAGRVLLVRHAPTSRIQAMKAISKRSVFAHDELRHTLAELNILKRFAVDEPHNGFVSKLHHAFSDRENFYFVMEFYPGGDLATQMEIYGILGHHRTRFYAADIVQGLEDLHRHGIIVRDLKPENILLNARGHAVLADFGLSKEFPYRGEPKKIHVVAYPGQPPLPAWAGAGAASSRLMPDGNRRLVVDRTDSFVGTAEYLSPEVVKRGDYSYAVDWWALGCIIFEGLIGRVPFRKREDEPPLVLWDRILEDPWDSALYDPHTGKLYEERTLDDPTWHFLDALLQKDPMWRLTEPHIKENPYFAYIDWETVKRGDYEDPFGLDIHPIAEYNTHYFPKLCLEETPTVDMSDHDGREHSTVPSPLNDNALYALAQAKHRTELEGFAWSSEAASTGRNDSASSCGYPEFEGFAIDMFDEEGTATEATSLQETIEEEEETSAEEDRVASPKLSLGHNEFAEVSDGIDDTSSPHSCDASSPADGDEGLVKKTQQVHNSPLVSNPVRSIRTLLYIGSPRTTALPLPLEPPVAPQTRETAAAVAAPIPIAKHTRSARPTSKPSTSKPSLNLPTGLPSSGLSVSDLVSITSPGHASSLGFFRRHPRPPSVESAPIARLSVELNGTITRLEDEEWEELELEGIESAPNGYTTATPSSFLSRGLVQVLRRRPSTLGASGLRRAIKTSDSSRDSSPTKLRPNPALLGRATTRKAIDKIKAFPKLRKLSKTASPALFAHTAPVSPPPAMLSLSPSTSPARPEPTRRHTESGWFDRRKLRKKASIIGELNIGKSLSMSGEKRNLKEDKNPRDKSPKEDKNPRDKSPKEDKNPRDKNIEEEKNTRDRHAGEAGDTKERHDGETAKASAGRISSLSGAGLAREAGQAKEPPKVELIKTPPVDWGLEELEGMARDSD